MTYKPELLSPAGSMEALVAAVQSGADAVYLGGKRFNARQYASNFDDEALREAVKYAHLRGVKVYITLNILVSDRELEEAFEYLLFLYNIGVDAVIVQDMGIASIIRETFPDFEVHASTQMTIYNLEGVKMLEDLGISRVVLARELSLKEVEYINSRSNIEVEVFIQGALCMCYSGQCLMSSIIGGRSGNRGRCAQPCRLGYSIVDREDENRVYRQGYLLSPRDLFTLEHMDRLLDARVNSFKIEGRMKRPEYVAAVTSIYRKAIDEYLRYGRIRDIEQGEKTIGKVFYRGFTKGYIFGTCKDEFLSCERPDNRGIYIGKVKSYDSRNGRVIIKLEDQLNLGDGIEFDTYRGGSFGTRVTSIKSGGKHRDSGEAGEAVEIDFKGQLKEGDRVFKTYDRMLMENLKENFSRENVRIPVHLAARFKVGTPSELYVWDEKGHSVFVKGRKDVEKAVNVPVNRVRIKEQLNRTGGTPYFVEGMEIDMDGEIFISISELNGLRREAFDRLSCERIRTDRQELSVTAKQKLEELTGTVGDEKCSDKVYLAVETGNSEIISSLIQAGADIVFLRYSDELGQKIQEVGAAGKLYLKLPLVTRRKEMEKIKGFMREYGSLFDGIEVSNTGQIYLCKQLDDRLKVHGGATLNILNRMSAKAFYRWGCDSVTLSPELNLSQIKGLASDSSALCEVVVHGRFRLMTIEYPLLEGLPQGVSYGLKDRKNMIFPLYLDGTGRVEICNSQPLFMLDKMDDVKKSGVEGIRLIHRDEEIGCFLELVKNYKKAISGGEYDEGLTELYIQQGITRGHFYRGVD